MTSLEIIDAYFEWLFNMVCGDNFARNISYRKLLQSLHATRFRYSILKDQNRAEDGVDLRWRFHTESGHIPSLATPCSVLEMMIALAIRCEENIMDDPAIGNRTQQWFWGMINNLGLGSMYDTNFDEDEFDYKINRFLDREYEPNGKGGLFTVRNCDRDVREVEIWYQLCWYLDSIT